MVSQAALTLGRPAAAAATSKNWNVRTVSVLIVLEEVSPSMPGPMACRGMLYVYPSLG